MSDDNVQTSRDLLVRENGFARNHTGSSSDLKASGIDENILDHVLTSKHQNRFVKNNDHSWLPTDETTKCRREILECFLDQDVSGNEEWPSSCGRRELFNFLLDLEDG